ncbi:MAG TPA: peptidoglycan-associated lipoprotein Pal [Methylophilaceae bacterium]|nr:peptidoglycan-associated lipoprotein Pal [Methylophilaceae bacterium]HQR60691.1 peptidoglycan-associated lipoprotein Pal [Methylophilaceae bacterium]
MNKQIIGAIVLALFLAACSSKQVKPEPAAPVENKDTTQSAPKPAGKSTDDSAQTKPVDQSKLAVNPLTDPANILSKRSIFFDFDKDEVKPEFRPLVEAHAKYLTSHPNAKVVLQGNADDRGTREYNLALGQRRAASVKKALNLLNASDKQIETVSYGEEKPRCTEQTETCWSQNRRVDIVYEGE